MKNLVYGSGTKIGNDREYCALVSVHIDDFKEIQRWGSIIKCVAASLIITSF